MWTSHPISIALMIAVGLIGLLAGALIGCVGVGGVIIVPAMVYGLGTPIQDATASAMMGYILTGLIGTVVYGSRGSIRWSIVGWLCLGAAPGVLLGTWGASVTQPLVLQLAVGLLLIVSSLKRISDRLKQQTVREQLPAAAFVAVGGVTGIISALTGTGGPVVLIPILLWLGMPTLVVVGLSQAIQIPVAIVGTAGNLLFGNPSLAVGVALAAGLAAGSLVGAKIAHVVPRDHLSRFTSVLFLIVGAAIVLHLGIKQLG